MWGLRPEGILTKFMGAVGGGTLPFPFGHKIDGRGQVHQAEGWMLGFRRWKGLVEEAAGSRALVRPVGRAGGSGPVLCTNPVGARPGDGVEVITMPHWEDGARALIPVAGVVAGILAAPIAGVHPAAGAALGGLVGLGAVPFVCRGAVGGDQRAGGRIRRVILRVSGEDPRETGTR